MMHDADVREAIRRVADHFEAGARATILYENLEKHVQEIGLIRDSSDEDGAVLDVGGGLGVNLLVLRSLGWRGPLVLVDRLTEYTSQNRMGSAEQALGLLRGQVIEVHQLDIWPDCRLPFEDATFDVATTFDVIEHLPGHPLRQLAEMRRVLKADGQCIVSVPNATSLMKHVHLALGHHPYMPFEEWLSDDYIYHYREYTADECRVLLERAGFRSIRTLLSRAVTLSRARTNYHRRIHHALSPTALALHAAALIEGVVARWRHSVYCVGVPDRGVNREQA